MFENTTLSVSIIAIHIWKQVCTHEETVRSKTGHEALRVLMTARTYRWWKKSQTTTWHVWSPIDSGIFTISTGAWFLPSTVRTNFANVGIGNPLDSTDSYFIGLEHAHLFLERPGNFLGCFSLSWWPNLHKLSRDLHYIFNRKKQVLSYKFHGSLTSFNRNTRV